MRVVIAGAGGGVGASVVFNLLVSPLECEVVMLDARENMLHSHLWDLEQVLEQTALGSVRAGSADDISGADVLVVTAAAPLTASTTNTPRHEVKSRTWPPISGATGPTDGASAHAIEEAA